MLKQNRKKIIIILGIIILPLIYSLFYLGAFWDPYGSLDNLPIALVNEDDCKGDDCLGSELVDTLKDKDVFKFEVVDSKTANSGLVDKDYYAVITIPSDFTSSLNNAASKDRKQTVISYSPNTKTNYLASQILSRAILEVETELQSQVSEKIVKELTDNLQSVPGQTAQISSALGQIGSGSKELNNGAIKLGTGTSTLANSYTTFNKGISTLNNGTTKLFSSYRELNTGINDVYKGSKLLKDKTNDLNTLVSGVSELKNGSDNLNTSLKTYQTKSNDMIDKAGTAYTLIINYVESHPEVQTDASLMNAYKIAKGYTLVDATGYNGLQQIKAGTSGLVSGSTALNNGINTMYSSAGKLNELKDGIDTLEASMLKIKNGSNEVYAGINTLNNGINSLTSNSSKVQSGINEVNSGVKTLKNGTDTLVNGVSTTKTEVDKKITDTESSVDDLDGLASYAKDPVKVDEDDYGNVTKYGTAFSPYFMSLSLWVGGILILMGLYYDPDQRFKVLGRNSENRTLRVVLYGVIGILQALILGFLLKLLLGFDVSNIFVYYGSCILISLTFLSIILFLFTTFKDVGKFIALVFLVLQLAACGGTFPIETEPQIYQIIYPFMPMTYSLDLLKESFININSSFLMKDILVLIIIWIVFTTLTVIVGIRKNKTGGKVINKVTEKKKSKKQLA